MLKIRALLLLAALSVHGQAVISPWLDQQYHDQNGNPLTNGAVYTCVAASSCPGTPLASYTNSSGSVANQNPVRLGSDGRASSNGSPVGIWLTANVPYKIVCTNAVGQVIPGCGGDNLLGSGGGGGGGGGGSGWNVVGNNVYQATSGSVGIGTMLPLQKLGIVGNEDLQGILVLRNSDATSHTIAISAPAGMAGNYPLVLPSSLPGSTSCLQFTSAGVGSFTACGGGGGGGGGANNYSQTFTSQTTVILTHNLNSTAVLTDCYDGSNVLIPESSITSITVTDANNVTVVFSGSTTGYCVVNASAGNPVLWTMSSNNVVLSNNAYTVQALTFEDQTASTGNTNVIFQNGAGQSGDLISFKNAAGSPLASVTMTGIFATVGSAPAGLDSAHGLDFSSVSCGVWSSTSAYNGMVDTALCRNGAGVLEIDNGTAGAYRDLILRNITINGTCTGSGCGGGGGGGSPPFSDATPIQMNAADNTKQMRFDLSSETTGTISVLSVQQGPYILAGTNISNTFSSPDTFSALGTFTAGINSTIFNSTVTGSSLAFQGGSGTFQVNGSGNVSALQYNAATSYNSAATGTNNAFTDGSNFVVTGQGDISGAHGLNIGNIGVLYPTSLGAQGYLTQLIVASQITGQTLISPGFTISNGYNVNNGEDFIAYNASAVAQVAIESIPGSAFGSPIVRIGGNGVSIGQTGGSNAIFAQGSWAAGQAADFSNTSSSSLASGLFVLGSGGASIVADQGGASTVGLRIITSASALLNVMAITGAPSGSCTNGTLGIRTDGAATGSIGYYCFGTSWHAVW